MGYRLGFWLTINKKSRRVRFQPTTVGKNDLLIKIGYVNQNTMCFEIEDNNCNLRYFNPFADNIARLEADLMDRGYNPRLIVKIIETLREIHRQMLVQILIEEL